MAGTESQLTTLSALIETSAADSVRLSSEISGHEGDLVTGQGTDWNRLEQIGLGVERVESRCKFQGIKMNQGESSSKTLGPHIS